MKIIRFRKDAKASSDAVAKKPNLLRRFARKAKQIFKTNPTTTTALTSTPTTPPAQLQEAAAQSSSGPREDPVLDPAEWLRSGTLPIEVLDPQETISTGPPSRAPCCTQPTPSASSVYSQLTGDDVDILLPAPQPSNLSESKQTTTARTAATEGSSDIPAATNQETEPEEVGKHTVHDRFQQSVDVGNTSFFGAPDAGYQHQRFSLLPTAPLTQSAEDYYDLFAVLFGTADESRFDCDDRQPMSPADVDRKPVSACFFSAQSYREVEIIRQQRFAFAARLEVELDIQKASLEADFEKCYDTSDRLHEIDLLNLREDHEAEVESLKEERDAGYSEIEKLTAQREGFQTDVLVLNSQVSGLEKLLGERTNEVQSCQRQASSLTEDNRELVGEIDRLRQVVEDCRARLLHAGHVHEVLDLQNKDLIQLNGDACDAHEAERKEKENVQRQLVALVEEKSKDFSWHIQGNRCNLTLKSENEEEAESKATAMARELCRRETEKVVKLSNELAEVRLATEAQRRREARTNANLSEIAQATSIALDACLHEKQELEHKYQELLTALSEDKELSELARGLSHDLQVAFEERSLFSLAFMKAEVQLVKSEQRRRDQVCDLRDLVQEKEDQLADAQKELSDAKLEISGQAFILEARDEGIRNTVPELKERIAELENIMERHAMDPSQFQTAVITDLNNRNQRQQQLAGFYEHQFMQTVYELDNVKAEWGFYLGGTLDDLQLARGFRDQRDTLNIECRALRERFADELLIQPLVVPEGVMTKSEIEEEQLKNMDEGVLKQFLMTYKALPKWLVEPGCPGYEQLRIDVMLPELQRQQKEREAIDLSFRAEGQDADGDGDKSEQLPEEEDEEDCTF